MFKSNVIGVDNLTTEQAKQMYAIMLEYYDNIIEDNFYSDLVKKKEVIFLYDAQGNVQGFTTVGIFLHDGDTQLLFSGDTIIRREHWGNTNISQAWINNAFLHADSFKGKTYWLLMTKGYKTYKFLHTFFNAFYPRVHTTTPDVVQNIMDTFAGQHYAEQYRQGVLLARKDFLKDKFAHIPETQLKNAHTAFFMQQNPNFAQGDELLCITELCLSNLNKLGRKMLGR